MSDAVEIQIEDEERRYLHILLDENNTQCELQSGNEDRPVVWTAKREKFIPRTKVKAPTDGQLAQSRLKFNPLVSFRSYLTG